MEIRRVSAICQVCGVAWQSVEYALRHLMHLTTLGQAC
jgi:hypothetical protein